MTHNSLLPTVRRRHGKEKKRKKFKRKGNLGLGFKFVAPAPSEMESKSFGRYQLLFEISCIDIAQNTMNPTTPQCPSLYSNNPKLKPRSRFEKL